MRSFNCFAAGVAASAAALLGPAAGAQDLIPVELPTEVNQAGAGVFAIPDFHGSKDYHAEGAGFAHLNFGNGMWLQLIGPEFKLNIVPNDFLERSRLGGLRLGPLVRWRPSRDNDVHDDIVSRMDRIPTATEVGAFISYNMPLDMGNPLHKIVVSADVAWDTNHAYDGSVGSIKTTYFHPFAQRPMGVSLLGAIGFGLFFGSDEFANRYFGVNARDALAFGTDRGGLPYRAEGGLVSVRVPFSLSSQFDKHWSVTVAGRYERLLDDAADSPIVRRTGDENQWVIGASVNYLFQ